MSLRPKSEFYSCLAAGKMTGASQHLEINRREKILLLPNSMKTDYKRENPKIANAN